VATRDGKLSAQFEHTVAVTASGVEVLTLREGERSRV
jgi:methionyl aminopeptidase